MLAKERHDIIYEAVCKNGAVTTSALVEKMGVSVETVRRDMLSMEQKGLIQRVHGGAVAKKSEMMPFSDLKTRSVEHSKQKRELAKRAAALISEGDIISIDSGSTANLFAEAVRDSFERLTVITHSLDVFDILRVKQDFKLILCGGQCMRDENAFYGPLALETLERLRIGKAFVCPSAISLDFGVADYIDELSLMQKQYIKSAESVFILADSSKFEKKAILRIAPMNEEHTYVTDSDLSPEIERLYTESGLTVYAGNK